MRVLGIPGSVRDDSHNLALLRVAAERLPQGAELETFGRLAEIPAYDEDVEAAGRPEPVEALRAAVETADAVLVATPEYNHSLPGVLKNALDWADRPARAPCAASRPSSWAPPPACSAPSGPRPRPARSWTRWAPA